MCGVSPRLYVLTPALSPGAVSLHLRHRLWHDPGYLGSICTPWDPQYPMHIPWTCPEMNLDHLDWVSPTSRQVLTSEIWTKSHGIGSQRRLSPESWHILASSTGPRHHLTSLEDPLPRLTTRNVQQNSMHLLKQFEMSWVDWCWRGCTVSNNMESGFGLDRCPPASPYFFFPILNFHRDVQINNYCMESSNLAVRWLGFVNLFKLWTILLAPKDAQDADRYSCRMFIRVYYSGLFPNSFHPSLDCFGSSVWGTIKSVTWSWDHYPISSFYDGPWAKREQL